MDSLFEIETVLREPSATLFENFCFMTYGPKTMLFTSLMASLLDGLNMIYDVSAIFQ